MTENKNKEKESRKEMIKKEAVVKKEEIKKARVKALGKDLPISTKHAVAICNAIKRKKVRIVQLFLADVIKKKKALPMKGEIPHRSGISTSGRYPVKATDYFAKLLNDLMANATVKNLDTENLIIIKAMANQASRPYKPSRIAYGRKHLKRTHVELEAEAEEIKIKEKKKKKEIKEAKEEVKEAKVEKPKPELKPKEEAKKPAEKPVEKKEEPKEEGKLKDGMGSDMKKGFPTKNTTSELGGSKEK